MNNELSDTKITWLTYLVYLLLVFLTFITGWQQFVVAGIQSEIKSLPDKYVRSERYLTDKQYAEGCLKDIQKDIKEILRVLK